MNKLWVLEKLHEIEMKTEQVKLKGWQPFFLVCMSTKFGVGLDWKARVRFKFIYCVGMMSVKSLTSLNGEI